MENIITKYNKHLLFVLFLLLGTPVAFAAGKMFVIVQGSAPILAATAPKDGTFLLRPNDNDVCYFSPTLGVDWQEMTLSFVPAKDDTVSICLLQRFDQMPVLSPICYDDIKINGATIIDGGFEQTGDSPWKLAGNRSSGQAAIIADPAKAHSGTNYLEVLQNNREQTFRVKKDQPVTVSLMVKGYSQTDVLMQKWEKIKNNISSAIDILKNMNEQNAGSPALIKTVEDLGAFLKNFEKSEQLRTTLSKIGSPNAFQSSEKDVDEFLAALRQQEGRTVATNTAKPYLPDKQFGDCLEAVNKAVKSSSYVKNDILYNFAFETDKLITMENKYYRIRLLHPVVQMNWDYGCRFVAGGWFKSIYLKECNKELLVTKSIFDNHPAFGLPVEFYDSLKIKDIDKDQELHLKIGVGLVARHGTNRYADTAVTLFPWNVATKNAGQSKEIIFTQSGNAQDYAYVLTRIFVFDETPVIKIRSSLKNTGKKAIKSDLYMHPFFKCPHGVDNCWYALADDLQKSDFERKPVSIKNEVLELSRSSKHAVWAGDKKEQVAFGISVDQEIAKLFFYDGNIGYGIEPFIRVKVSPGKSQQWEWQLLPKAEPN